MKQLTIVICAGLVALVLWRITENISSDALGLAIGVMFGVLAGLPTAVLVLASQRQARRAELPGPKTYVVVLPTGTDEQVIDAPRIEVLQ